ncbi:MAG: NADPH:quinone oxidoreductase family protein [Dongiaceae bacterium]
MRAVIARALGGIEQLALEERAQPGAPGPDEVTIEVAAAGCNFADLVLLAGQYQEQQTPPFVPGLEAAGRIVAAGKNLSRDLIGARVLVIARGAFAEYLTAPVSRIVAIPDAMDFVTAAGFAIAYGTAYGALAWPGRLQPGERLLVLGAAGGVGLTAVEVGKAMGAEVIACAGGADKLALAKKHGADFLIDYRREDLRERLKKICLGGGPDVVFDPVGGDMFDKVLRQANWGARLVIVGFAGGSVPQIPANILLVKNVAALGFNFGSWLRNRPDAISDALAQLFVWWGEGRLKPHISARYDLADAASALALLRDRKATGKIVLTTGRAAEQAAR